MLEKAGSPCSRIMVIFGVRCGVRSAVRRKCELAHGADQGCERRLRRGLRGGFNCPACRGGDCELPKLYICDLALSEFGYIMKAEIWMKVFL